MDMHQLSLVKSRPASEPSTQPFPVSMPERLRDQLLTNLAKEMEPFLAEACQRTSEHLEADIREFYEVSRQNKAFLAHGTTSPGTLLWLFVIARRLQPQSVVESGVFRGSSLFTLRRACPAAEIQAFDLDLGNLAFEDTTIGLHAFDWSVAPVQARSPFDLCYFDDHINNCLRIKQAHLRGFRFLVFDDSPSVANLHTGGRPGVPTAQMLADGIQEGETVSWIWNGEEISYTFHRDHGCGAQALVEAIYPLPDIGPWTGFRNPASCFVRLRPPKIPDARRTTLWNDYANPYELTIRAQECAHAVARCRWLVDGGRHAEAQRLLEEVLEAEPEEPTARYLLGFCLHTEGRDLDRALANYAKALELGFSPFWVHYNCGSLLAALKNRSEAEKHLLAAHAIDPAHSGVGEMLRLVRDAP